MKVYVVGTWTEDGFVVYKICQTKGLAEQHRLENSWCYDIEEWDVID